MIHLNGFRSWTIQHAQGIGSLAVFVIGLGAAVVANAQISTGIPPITNTTALHSIICNIFGDMFYVLLSVSVIMALWGAYLYVFSEGDAERPSEAKMALLYAAIGLVVGLMAKGAPFLIASLFGASSSVKGC